MSPDRVGVLEIHWAAARIRVAAENPVAGRAHGLLALADGGFLAVANRPGRWLLRCDARGQVQQRLAIDSERPLRTFNGHVETSAAGGAGGTGDWLYTTETDPETGAGWISVRDARTLSRVAQFVAGGRDPHQLLRARDGSLLVAIGGIVRDREGHKIEAGRMAPSLARLAPAQGIVLGQWQLDDPRLSIRHLAWARAGARPAGDEVSGDLSDDIGDAPLLGLALQAEHEQEDRRRNAPALAVWDGESLHIATADAGAAGYAGDIAAGPGGGFVISAQKARRGLWWHPSRPERLTPVAELTEPCALATVDGGAGVLISAGRGAARWHAREAPAMLPWPVALAPDNHWVVLRRA
ncbi:MAG: DUF1513 domain-containing protein [Burkholderiales bacterium]|nr:DUF1513 domain-containing protein [Burkholderiales bacterium]